MALADGAKTARSNFDTLCSMLPIASAKFFLRHTPFHANAANILGKFFVDTVLGLSKHGLFLLKGAFLEA